jgi:hypothetical protein
MGIWRKSTYSDANGGNCVETASADSVVLVRDTTNRDGGTLALSAAAWMVFTGKIKGVLRESHQSGRPRCPLSLRSARTDLGHPQRHAETLPGSTACSMSMATHPSFTFRRATSTLC